MHIRFLVALPSLIASEPVAHERMRFVVRQFLERHLIPASALTRFEAAIAAPLRLRNSVLAEVLLIAFVSDRRIRATLISVNTQTEVWSNFYYCVIDESYKRSNQGEFSSGLFIRF